MARLLVAKRLVTDPAEAARLARYGEGSVQRAVELADADLWTCRRDAAGELSAESWTAWGWPRVSAFIDEAGKEAPARRARLRQVVAFAAEFYRRLLHAAATCPCRPIPSRRPLEAAAPGFRGDAIVAAAWLDRCLEAPGQIDRNANQSTLIEAWLDDLAAETAVAPSSSM